MTFSLTCFFLAAVLLGATARAYPPAPDHVLFGTVRDELGRPLAVGSAVVIVSHAAGSAPIPSGGRASTSPMPATESMAVRNAARIVVSLTSAPPAG